MISTKTLGRAFAAFMLAIAGGAPLLVSNSADARSRSTYYSQTYETKGPVRGYEGFISPGTYCSYRRYPVRQCAYDSRGREICKITSWRLEQSCS